MKRTTKWNQKKNTVVSPPRMFLFSLGNTPKCRLFLSNSGFILTHCHFCQVKLVKIVTKVCLGLKGENTDPSPTPTQLQWRCVTLQKYLIKEQHVQWDIHRYGYLENSTCCTSFLMKAEKLSLKTNESAWKIKCKAMNYYRHYYCKKTACLPKHPPGTYFDNNNTSDVSQPVECLRTTTSFNSAMLSSRGIHFPVGETEVPSSRCPALCHTLVTDSISLNPGLLTSMGCPFHIWPATRLSDI